jgi:hypothetical protein
MNPLLFTALLASSQPQVDCSLLTPAQAHGLPCAVRQVTAPPLLPEGCWPAPDPYAEPDRAALCSLLSSPPPPPVPTYVLGGRYVHAYPSQRLLVTELRLEESGHVSVGGRWLTHSSPELVGTRYWFTAGQEPFFPVEPQ